MKKSSSKIIYLISQLFKHRFYFLITGAQMKNKIVIKTIFMIKIYSTIININYLNNNPSR